jgi:TonB family protein
MQRHGRQRRSLASFFGVSLLLHLQIILIAIVVISTHPEGCRPPDDFALSPVEVSLVPEVTDSKREQEVRRKEIEEEQKRERDREGQVVDLPRPRDERSPDEAKYLSEYDSSVERETKATGRRSRSGRAVPRPARPGARSASPSDKPQRREPPARLAMRTKPRVPKSRLAPSLDGDEAAAPEPARPSQPKRRGRQSKRLAPGALHPTPEELREAIGGGTIDALMGVEEGAETLLNSRRWRFASFFNRVKRQVAQNWHPDREYRRRDPQGNVYGFKDRLTILRVKLNPRGGLEGMHLEKPSGLGFLDDEAMNAFRLAQPFPNPPRGLVDAESGMISFRFGFLFEISRRPNFRILRFRN